MSQNLMTVFDIVAAVLEEESFPAAAAVAATELATHAHCDRVTIGFIKKQRIEIVALSHSATFQQRMDLHSTIASAMEESLDQQCALLFPPLEEKNAILRNHEELHRRYGSPFILTIPFVGSDATGYGALCLERHDPITSETTILCEALVALLGPILLEKKHNSLPLYAKAAESVKTELKKHLGPQRTGGKILALSLVVLALFLGFARGDFRITAAATLEGTIQRAVIAPFTGYLAQAHLRAGDLVAESQPLATLDTRDLTLERISWSSQQKQRTLEYHKAMAENDIAAAKIIQEQISQATSQLSLLEEQIARAEIRSPLNGLIISGDLSHSIGAPVERGQVLFEIAPLDSFRILLKVDERDINHLEIGREGTLSLDALPGMRFSFVVEKITPVSISEQGQNFFQVEAQLTGNPQRLRPGMEGYGKIDIDRRRLAWIWTHKLVDRARYWLWSKTP